MDFDSDRVRECPSAELSSLQGASLRGKPPVPPRLGTDPVKRRFREDGELRDSTEPVYAHFVRYDARSQSARLVRTEIEPAKLPKFC